MRQVLILYSFFLVTFCNAGAQNLTGTWEGVMDDEILQLNFQDEELCGYSYDYALQDSSDHCKVYFITSYNETKREWFLSGQQFIENSGNHVLMHIWIRQGTDANTLYALVRPKTYGVPQLAGGIKVILHKVKTFPLPPANGLNICWRPNSNFNKKPMPAPDVITPSPDTSFISIPVKPGPDTPTVSKYKARKNIVIQQLESHAPTINMAVYDNGIIDGDTVSIFFNGELIIHKELLSSAPILRKLELISGQPNEVILFAENLGSIPPNTAIVIFSTVDQRFELKASTSLQENAVLIINYHP